MDDASRLRRAWQSTIPDTATFSGGDPTRTYRPRGAVGEGAERSVSGEEARTDALVQSLSEGQESYSILEKVGEGGMGGQGQDVITRAKEKQRCAPWKTS